MQSLVTSAEHERFNGLLPVCVAVGASIVFLSLLLYSPDSDVLYIFLIAPITCFICLFLLLLAVIDKKPRQFLSILLTLVVFLAASWGLLKNEVTLRGTLRWLLLSHHYKAEVLAQPLPANGELRHMAWQATGFAGVANNTVYLVFDPTDSLSHAAKSHTPGRFRGIPCEVPKVHRLERQWYFVQFYTDEQWGDCPYSDRGVR